MVDTFILILRKRGLIESQLCNLQVVAHLVIAPFYLFI